VIEPSILTANLGLDRTVKTTASSSRGHADGGVTGIGTGGVIERGGAGEGVVVVLGVGKEVPPRKAVDISDHVWLKAQSGRPYLFALAGASLSRANLVFFSTCCCL